MTTLLDTNWYGYKVKVKPHEWQRRLFHYHHWYPFYMNDCQIWLKLTITAPKEKRGQPFKYSWYFTNDAGNVLFGSGDNQVQTKKRKYKTSINSEILRDTAKYTLKFRLTIPNEVEVVYHDIALLTLKERDDVSLQYVLPFILSLVTLGVSVVLSIIASVITANIMGD
jgi:hypothetical protein